MQQNQKDPTALLINGLHNQQLFFLSCLFLQQRSWKKFLGRETTPRETHRCNCSRLRAILKMLVSCIARTDPNHTDQPSIQVIFCNGFLFSPAKASRCKICFCPIFSFNHLKTPQECAALRGWAGSELPCVRTADSRCFHREGKLYINDD